ncbi:MAG: PadR family transcriptional regulator [Acidobacteria bacterium]|nr:PadR family transcriptional regulator [Acidobacteriota bacterium]
MRQPDVLGGFEHQVLLAVARLDGETYSAPIVLELQRRTGREVASAAVFVTLRRLEKRGYLTSARDTEGGRVGRPRRIFELTASGADALREARATLDQLWQGLTLPESR